MSAVPTDLAFFATAPKGMETLLAAELRTLGAAAVEPVRAGVAFRGTLETGYRACLWCRTASRVLLPLARFAAADPDALYAGVHALPWEDHLAPDGTLAVDFGATRSVITHSHFGALKTKDAIVDRLRDLSGERPSVDVERPDLRVNVYLYRDEARISIDLSGDSLHRRGYRERGVAAPLKENLAAAILLAAGWPARLPAGSPFLDPMCGSGTLPIEAAWLAADIAPGLLREHWGFLGWRGHDPALWAALQDEAQQRRRVGLARLPAIVGYDQDRRAVHVALGNAERAGLHGHVHFERRALADARPVGDGRRGLVAVNPPYGERLGRAPELVLLYGELGEVLRRHFPAWRAAVFSANPPLLSHTGLPAARSYDLYNGALPCTLRVADLPAEPEVAADPGAEMFANRLRKNRDRLKRWVKRDAVCCYRLYDADLPEYALAVDLYQGAQLWAHVQEYQAPASVDPARAAARLQGALAVLPEALGIPRERIHFKVRSRQKGSAQYQRLGSGGPFHEVEEGGCRLLVNFTDYLDTGLFLDHRGTRAYLQRLAAGRRCLNLFGYTGSATVHMARGGGAATVTVDMSRTYLDWAHRNLALNGFGPPHHELVQADCLEWLAAAAAGPGRYGLIFLDPPTFSNSKRMAGSFDVQRDHGRLLELALQLLEPGGLLVFSTNHRRFRLDTDALAAWRVTDISERTIPPDFARNPRIHRCWVLCAPGMEPPLPPKVSG